MVGDPPVEAVAAEVDEAPARLLERGEGVEHPLRRVLGVGAGEHAGGSRRESSALGVEVVLGEHVIGDCLLAPASR